MTIGRQTLGPEGQEGPDSTAPPLGMGGMGAGSIGMGGMGAMNPWMNGMNFGKAWRYALNPATRPKSIDFLSTPGGTLLGIYDLSGDRLTMCLGPQRPKGLAIGPEDKTALVVLQRVTGSGRQGNPRSWPAVESLASPADQRKPPRPLAVNVDRDGTAAIAGMPIEDDRLQTLVGLLLGDNPRRQVCLRCDADLPFSRAVDLLAVLKAAGMPRSSVLLATAPTPAARLDFRIAAIPGKDGDKSSITAAEIKRYREDLQAHGPTYGRAAWEQAQRIARQNALADLIGSLEGIEKVNVRIDAPPASGGEDPPTANVSVAVQTPAAGLPGEELLQQVRNLVTAVVPGVEPDEVKVVGANVKPAAGAEAKDSKPVPADRATDEQYAWFELAAEAPRRWSRPRTRAGNTCCSRCGRRRPCSPTMTVRAAGGSPMPPSARPPGSDRRCRYRAGRCRHGAWRH